MKVVCNVTADDQFGGQQHYLLPIFSVSVAFLIALLCDCVRNSIFSHSTKSEPST